MLKINYEFRKGIFFIRLFGELSKDTYKQKAKEIETLILTNDFKYIVVNTNYLKVIDISGLNYINKIYYMVENNNNKLVICDKFQIIKRLLNCIPSIESELEVL